jgi:hypothetical protein
MSKTLNQIFFFLHQNQNIFLEKNHNHPLQVKWSFPKVNTPIVSFFLWQWKMNREHPSENRSSKFRRM